MISTGRYQGKQYSCPWFLNVEGLWYRTDLVPVPPKTAQQVVSDAEQMPEMNLRLEIPPEIDVSVSLHMGLFAVSRLAARLRIRVRLRAASPPGLFICVSHSLCERRW
jgi:hypothetical protein